MKDPTEILMAIALETLKHGPRLKYSSWAFRKGVKLFINPAAQCPNCLEWVDTQRVWLVDDSHAGLKGCWFMNGTKVDKNKEIIHPHVSLEGRICVGTSQCASGALFIGISDGMHYQDTKTWFYRMGHNCRSEILKEDCWWCGEKHPYEYIVYLDMGRFNLCRDRIEILCCRCDRWVDSGENEASDHYCPCDCPCGCGNDVGGVFESRCEDCKHCHCDDDD